jgi:branched-chain amino acid aminotransferase
MNINVKNLACKGDLMNPVPSSSKMAIYTWKLILQHSQFSLEDVTDEYPGSSLDEISSLLPQGAYTTFRTYFHNRILRFNDHLQRLTDSAIRANTPVSIDRDHFHAGLREILLRNPYPDSRLRVTLDLEKEPGVFYISLEQLHTPPESVYRNGGKVLTLLMQRENAKAKLTGFIQTAAKYRTNMPPDINEILMLDDHGYILEGLSSNFFGIVQGSLSTADEGVLNGITRSMVILIAGSQGYPVKYASISVNELSNLDECFITSASRGVLPIVQVDKVCIGNGRPGQMTRRLMDGFNQWIENEVQEL